MRTIFERKIIEKLASDRQGCDGFSRIQSVSEQVEVRRSAVNSGERGYALVGLMGVMLFALILTTAAAPRIKYESQREREEEMLWRGQQIQRALMLFSMARQNQYPRELKELVEGVMVGIKKVRFLRPSALCDPMSPCEPGESNWRLVHPGDPLPKELMDALISFQQQQNGVMIQIPGALRTFAQMGSVKLPGQESESDTQTEENGAPAAGGPPNTPGLSGSDNLPIIGVVSRKTDEMFRSYYGIESYDHALFFPGVPVVAGGFNRAALIGSGSNQQRGGGNGNGMGNNCKQGEISVGGQCIRAGQQLNSPGQGQAPQ
jgi:hypothetical protein